MSTTYQNMLKVNNEDIKTTYEINTKSNIPGNQEFGNKSWPINSFRFCDKLWTDNGPKIDKITSANSIKFDDMHCWCELGIFEISKGFSFFLEGLN